MVHWGWLILAVTVGGMVGVIFMALIAAGAWHEKELNHFAEVQRLRDENRNLRTQIEKS